MVDQKQPAQVAHGARAGRGALLGVGVGAALGAGIGLVLQNVGGGEGLATLFVDWPVGFPLALALAGSALGAVIGSFARLPAVTYDPSEEMLGRDPFEGSVLIFLIPVALVLFIAFLIVSFGSVLLSVNKEAAVIAALVATGLIALACTFLSFRDPSPGNPASADHSH